jgi:NADH:ubiquinone oxidoreductase subunit 3 (subunit A)
MTERVAFIALGCFMIGCLLFIIVASIAFLYTTITSLELPGWFKVGRSLVFLMIIVVAIYGIDTGILLMGRT